MQNALQQHKQSAHWQGGWSLATHAGRCEMPARTSKPNAGGGSRRGGVRRYGAIDEWIRLGKEMALKAPKTSKPLGLICLHGSTLTCATSFAGIGLSSPIVAAVADTRTKVQVLLAVETSPWDVTVAVLAQLHLCMGI